VGAQILSDLGLKNIRLLTNNPRKVVGLAAYGLKVVDRVGLQVKSRPTNARYLATKRQKLGHLLLSDTALELDAALPSPPASGRASAAAPARAAARSRARVATRKPRTAPRAGRRS
jgi:3,4-dihydroxy 2-butanone 4-phosphate synthase / GTP cyclohydrolase II